MLKIFVDIVRYLHIIRRAATLEETLLVEGKGSAQSSAWMQGCHWEGPPAGMTTSRHDKMRNHKKDTLLKLQNKCTSSAAWGSHMGEK
jgi:hypothetical protein